MLLFSLKILGKGEQNSPKRRLMALTCVHTYINSEGIREIAIAIMYKIWVAQWSLTIISNK